MRKRDIVGQALKHGFTVEFGCYKPRRQDATWYANESQTNDPLVRFMGHGHIIEVIPAGDVTVESKKKRYTNRRETIPEHVLAKAANHPESFEWLNNNWFEVNSDGSSWITMEEPYYEADEAILATLEEIEDIAKIEAKVFGEYVSRRDQ